MRVKLLLHNVYGRMIATALQRPVFIYTYRLRVDVQAVAYTSTNSSAVAAEPGRMISIPRVLSSIHIALDSVFSLD